MPVLNLQLVLLSGLILTLIGCGQSDSDAPVVNRKPSTHHAAPKPKGEVRKGVTEKELTLPFYPGSTDTAQSQTTVNSDSTEYASVRASTDDAKKISEFYTSKLGKPEHVMGRQGIMVMLWGKGKDSEVVNIRSTPAGTQITLKRIARK